MVSLVRLVVGRLLHLSFRPLCEAAALLYIFLVLLEDQRVVGEKVNIPSIPSSFYNICCCAASGSTLRATRQRISHQIEPWGESGEG
jgi:hypothetical protein